MNRFILFIKKIYVLLLFILIEVVALNYYASSTSYTKAKLLTASNIFVGGIHRSMSNVGDYFGLRSENDALLERLAYLNNELEYYKEIYDTTANKTLKVEFGKYEYMPASVINNSVTRQQNYIMIDKGERDGVRINMALITPEGYIVGYILDCSDKFSIAISIINTEFRTGGKIKGSEYFGSVYWNGLDHSFVTLSEIPKYADIQKGDTILTGYSSIFPPDVLVGTIESYDITPSNYFEVKVRLAPEMSRLKKVLVVNYADIQERQLLEEAYIEGGNR